MKSTDNPIQILNNFLDNYLNFEKLPAKNIFWLDTMEFLCREFNNPQNSAPCIHVAGSKGKGSMSVMIASIIKEAGNVCGLYSSPHILDFTERVSNCTLPFSDDIYSKSASELISRINSIPSEKLPGGRPLTWFELVTMFSFLTFRNAGTNWNVFEVGLGGRLDATNVISPKLVLIGPIELEHTEFLGDTVEKIAEEKAGVIKQGVTVISAPQVESVKNVFKKKCLEKQARLIFIDEVVEFDFDTSKVSNNVYKSEQSTKNSSKLSKYVYKIRQNSTVRSSFFNRPLNLSLTLMGKFQVINGAMAAVGAKILFPNLPESVIEKGLSKASLPGRFEIVTKIKKYSKIPAIVFDGAHTVNSISGTLQNYFAIFPKENVSSNLIFGLAQDKDAEDIAVFFKDGFHNIILTKPGEVKHSDLPRLVRAFDSNNISYCAISDYKKAIKTALEDSNKKGRVLLVTGSFYLIAEVKKFLLGL